MDKQPWSTLILFRFVIYSDFLTKLISFQYLPGDYCDAQLQTLLQKCNKNYDTGCLLWPGNVNSYGRIRFSIQGQPARRYYVHRLIYMFTTRMDLSDEGVELSHLCHTPRCVRYDHIVPEPHSTNMERLHCKKQGHCIGSHEPKCLL